MALTPLCVAALAIYGAGSGPISPARGPAAARGCRRDISLVNTAALADFAADVALLFEPCPFLAERLYTCVVALLHAACLPRPATLRARMRLANSNGAIIGIKKTQHQLLGGGRFLPTPG